jgi:hypothetical protein
MRDRFRSKRTLFLRIAIVVVAGALTAPLYGSGGGTFASENHAKVEL